MSRTTPFLIGLASLLYICVNAYYNITSGDQASLIPLSIIIAAAIPLLLVWRREISQNPAVIPSVILAVCTLFSIFTIQNHLVFNTESITVGTASWSKFFSDMSVYIMSGIFTVLISRYVYKGSLVIFATIHSKMIRRHDKPAV